LLDALATRMGWPGAAALSSAAFALSHVVPTAVLPAGLLAIPLVLARRWSGSIWPCIGIHAGLNAAILVRGIPPRAGSVPTGMDAALFALALGLGVVSWVFRKNGRHVEIA
jgi:membrane protease YdiL (CAAX protease family)